MAAVELPKLAETSWLQEHLDDPDLRIFDCSVALRVVDGVVSPESGRSAWQKAHIPGSGFLDLIADLSDRNSVLPFMLPPEAQFAAAMSKYGIGDSTRVVLYDTGVHTWATRMWWMLRVYGFDNAAVLNGGWRKWTAEMRPVSDEGPRYPPAVFTPRKRPHLVADKKEVQDVIPLADVCLINALSPEEHAGAVPRKPRSGRIPGSKNVPAASLIDSATGAYLPFEVLREKFGVVGAFDCTRVVTYCGGGISATSDAFVLHLLGAKDVAVYDGSLSEWLSDPSLPIETG